MKKLIFLFFLLPSLSFSQVGFEFRSVAVSELIESVLKGILKRDYVISPEVVLNTSKLTLSLKNIEQEKVLSVLQSVVLQAGIEIEEKSGVLYVRQKTSSNAFVQPSNGVIPDQNQRIGVGSMLTGPQHVVPKELSFHRPRGKSVEFLSSVARVGGAYVPELKGKTDVVVFGGDRDVIERVQKLFDQIDLPAESVIVKAALVEYTEAKSDTRSFSLALSLFGSKFGAVYNAGSKLANALTLKSTPLSVVLSAIDGDSRFKYVAEPQLRVMNGEIAKFTVGSEVPTRGSTSVDKNGNPTQSIEYKSAGVIITIEPKVLKDVIHLKIGQQVSSFTLTNTSNIDSPTMLKREAETTVIAKDGEVIVLAGMDENRDSSSATGLSFLPSFLRSNDLQVGRTQMLLLLEAKRVTDDQPNI